ncbi:MAG: BatA domain-containing protein [Bacteroidia bacterium]|nr:BatA domain-containing protein [Bacteroidia bacterium]
MSFLYPGFLFALLVLAIPVVIHLFHFRRYKTIRFSSLRFLRNIETERKNRNKLKHYLVLASRLLGLLCLVFAFAIPGCKNNLNKNTGKKTVRIFIDNSYSMQNRNSQGILFESAKIKAREIIKSLGSNAEFSILSQTVSSEKMLSAQEAIEAIDKLDLSPRSITAKQVWKQATQFAAQGNSGNDLLYVISDFQSAFLRNIPTKDSNSIRSIGVKLPAAEIDNLSLDSAWLMNPFALAGEKNKLMYKLTNYGPEDLESINVKLTSLNNTIGLAQATVAKNTSIISGLEFTMPADSKQGAVLQIEDPINPFDNELFISLHPQGDIRIGMVGSNSFLNAALKANTFFNISQTQIPNLQFPQIQVVYVLVDAPISQADASKLSQFANQGGQVVIVPGDKMQAQSLAALNSNSGFPVFQNYSTSAVKIRVQGLAHPFFEQVFYSMPARIEMPLVKGQWTTSGNTGMGEAILSLENGEPFLMKFKQGRGAFFLFTSPFNPIAGNFVQSVLFFPVVANCAMNQKIQGQIFGFAASQTGYVLHSQFEDKDGNIALKSKKGEWIAEIQNGLSGQELFIGNEIQEPGFYELLDKTNPSQKEIIALNVNRLESNPAVAETELLNQFAKNTGLTWLDPQKTAAASKNIDESSNLWRLFIWLAAAFFAVEVIILVFWDTLQKKLFKTTTTATT